MNKVFTFLIACLLLPSLAPAKFIETDRFSAEGKGFLTTASVDADNSKLIRHSAQLQLGLEGKLTDQVFLGGRVDAYKYWGDFNKVYTDTIRAERAYLNWSNIADSDLYLSIGRRPSFYKPPSNPTGNKIHSGTAYGEPIDFNIDGATIGYRLSTLTGVPGMNIHIGYGRAIDSEWGNDNRLKDGISENLADADIGGINFDLYNDGKTFLQLSLFRAMDVNDGVNGSVAFPAQLSHLYEPSLYQDMPKFPIPPFTIIHSPRTTIGDINLIGLNASHKTKNGVTLFGSAAMSQLDSNGQAGLFGGLGSDAVFQAKLSDDGSAIVMVPVRAENAETREGYSIYLGTQLPTPVGKLGLEYNYGSKYWMPLNQAQNDALGNKLTTRGHAAEAYYILNIKTM